MTGIIGGKGGGMETSEKATLMVKYKLLMAWTHTMALEGVKR